MQLFGLVSLIITLAIAAWWLTTVVPATPATSGDTATSTEIEAGGRANYREALDSAQSAAEALGQ